MSRPAESFDLGATAMQRLLQLLGRPDGPMPVIYTELLQKKAAFKTMGNTAENSLRRAILEAFPELGRVPTLTELVKITDMDPISIRHALDNLDHLDLVVSSRRCQILVAYPFSSVPTMHRVLLENNKAVFAVCAVSALGIAYMLRQDTKIESCCHACNKPINVEIVGGRVRAIESADALVWVPDTEPHDTAAISRCPTMSFFCNEKDLRSAMPPDQPGSILNISQAAETGKLIFWDYLY